MKNILDLKSFLLIIISVVFGWLVFSSQAQAITVDEYCMEPEEQEFLRLINDYRAQNNVGPLVALQTLGAAAEHKSLDFITCNYFDHNMPGPDCRFGTSDDLSWNQSIWDHGYQGNAVGENVLWGYSSAQQAFNAWKGSPGHNANMLWDGFTAIGIGRVADGTGRHATVYWSTEFGGGINPPAPVARVCTPTTTTPTPVVSPTPGNADTVSPSVTITAPLDSSTVPVGSKATIMAFASDNIGVTKVEFFINGKRKCSAQTSPYTCLFNTGRTVGAIYTLTAKAYDSAGNTASSTVRVTAE